MKLIVRCVGRLLLSPAFIHTLLGNPSENNDTIRAMTHGWLSPGFFENIDDISLNYRASIHPTSQNTFILVHGFAASLETWSDLFPLIAQEHSVYAIDLKGAGFSDKPRCGKYDAHEQARLLYAFMIQKNLTNVVLVGHSLGGGISLLTYLIDKKTEPRIVGLILIDSACYPQPLPFHVRSFRNPILYWFLNFVPADFQVNFVLSRILKRHEAITPHRVEQYSRFLREKSVRRANRMMAKSIVPGDFDEVVDSFSSITVPTLIIWGENDPVIPLSHGERLAQEIKDSQLLKLKNVGHIPQEESPVEVFDFIRSKSFRK